MNAKLSQSQKLLHDSLFELYIEGGLELYLAGTRGFQRDLIIDQGKIYGGSLKFDDRKISRWTF
jgi:hypothetical protein